MHYFIWSNDGHHDANLTNPFIVNGVRWAQLVSVMQRIQQRSHFRFPVPLTEP